MRFALRFSPSQIKTLSGEYEYSDDNAALGAGERIAAGDYSIANLKKIVVWKSSRSTGRFDRNTEDDVADALRLAVTAKTDRAAIAVLLGLNGVQIPVASAILTAIHPDRFTIIDYRALESLGVKQPSPSIGFYLEYLDFCRALARKHRVSLRVLDRALWQWSSDQDSNK